MDAVGRRRAGAGAKTSVVVGSVWESRMKIDEVRGGIKVFNGEENSDEGNGVVGTKLKRGQTGVVGAVSSGKRKTWKSETFEGFEKSPIQIAKGKPEPQRNSEEQCKELSVSVDGLKKSPIPARKLRSEGSKEIVVAGDKAERSPIGMRKRRSESLKSPVDLGKEAGEGIGRNSVQSRKGKSDSIKVLAQSDKDNDGSNGAIQLRKAKSEPNKALVESDKGIDVSFEEIEKNPVENGETGSDETCKEFGVCQDKVISSSVSNVGVPDSAPKALVHQEDYDDQEDEGDEEQEVVDEEIGVEKKSLGDEEQEEVDEEIEVEVEKKSLGDEVQEEVDEKIEVEVEKKSLDIKEISTPVKKPNKVIKEKKVVNEVKKLHFERKEIRKFHQVHQNPEPISINVKKQPPVIKRATVHSNFAKPTFPASNEYQNFPESHNRLQSFVDLIMWKDIPRSVFIFGIGTFIILSSSYTKDLNISFISVISYLGLVYLAAIFLFRSVICRGVLDVDNTSYVLGEEESIWLVKLVLPYLNEFLLKLKALFSGDPSTTMKLAALLFVLARCGNFITIWTMAKLGFFGVFTVPKVCSLYSHHITAYAKFWGRRFRDAWDSCSHKKGLTVAIFLLVWNLSSIVARIWAVFMLFVAFRYYQQSLELDDDWVEDDAEDEETWHEPVGGHVQGNGPTFVDIAKPKKNF